ncbi:MAG: GMC family oxidoreductase [Gammaproteobacteria bacterium]|nr:hypothetical protein [Gammaproteobacteria bacterium]
MKSHVSNFDAFDAVEPFDVCVIGAGLAGCTVALRLVRAGLRVLLIDSASLRELESPRPRRCEINGDTRYASARRKPWDGACERLERGDFRAHPYDDRSNPWPIGYADLEPHYRAAERLLRVRGPFSRPNPCLPERKRRRGERKLEAWIRERGMDVRSVALATPGTGRRFLPVRELLPEFVATRTGTLVTSVTATRLRTDDNGRVIGALCRAPDGTAKTARALSYVIAAGAIETPRLLLLSRTRRSPLGLGNERDRVGRGFADQAVVDAYGSLLPSAVCWPARSMLVHTDEFHRLFRRDGLGSIHPFLRSLDPLEHARRLGKGLPGRLSAVLTGWRRLSLAASCRVEIAPSDTNRISLSRASKDEFGDPIARIDFDFSHEDLRLIAKVRAWLERWLDRFGAIEKSQGEIDWADTPTGTCRMGVDARTSVCDASLRVHTTPNLYVCGGAVLPRVGALPIELTVAALADRLADHLVARARWCARSSARPQRAAEAHPVATPIPLVRRRPQS